jgi:hypothetical protein
MKEFSPICWYKEDGKHIRLRKTRNYVPEFLSVITDALKRNEATHHVRHDDIFHAIDKVDTEICPSGNSAEYRETCLCSCKLMYTGVYLNFLLHASLVD